MTLCNYHTHSTYCDGVNTVAEMAQAALEKGFRALGFSGHAHSAYDTSYCMRLKDQLCYVQEVLEARERYRGQMELYLGAEDDFYGERPAFACDYTIGSVHTVCVDGTYVTVDNHAEILLAAAREHFGGDLYALCARYFSCVAQVQAVTGCDIIGHFDLVSKFNEGGRLFDEADARYLTPALEAVEALCTRDALFEINTGAVWRGYRSAAYPSMTLLRAIHAFGGSVVLCSDCHDAKGLDFGLADAAALARACGFESRRVLLGGKWCEIGIEE